MPYVLMRSWWRGVVWCGAGLALVPASEIVPAPADKARPISGYPQGAWLNYGSWSPDGKHVSFTVGAGRERGQRAEGWPPRTAWQELAG